MLLSQMMKILLAEIYTHSCVTGLTLVTLQQTTISTISIQMFPQDLKRPDSAFAVRPDGSFWMFESAEPDSAPVRMSYKFFLMPDSCDD